MQIDGLKRHSRPESLRVFSTACRKVELPTHTNGDKGITSRSSLRAPLCKPPGQPQLAMRQQAGCLPYLPDGQREYSHRNDCPRPETA